MIFLLVTIVVIHLYLLGNILITNIILYNKHRSFYFTKHKRTTVILLFIIYILYILYTNTKLFFIIVTIEYNLGTIVKCNFFFSKTLKVHIICNIFSRKYNIICYYLNSIPIKKKKTIHQNGLSQSAFKCLTVISYI